MEEMAPMNWAIVELKLMTKMREQRDKGFNFGKTKVIGSEGVITKNKIDPCQAKVWMANLVLLH